MTTAIPLPLEVREQRFLLSHVSWEAYESLLADHTDANSPRFTYSEGMLEMMRPSGEHEKLNKVMETIADILLEERQVEFKSLGSTTFRRRELRRGTEPDSCFYIQNAERIRGKKEIDLTVDPPPDLVIEWKSPALLYLNFRFMPAWACPRSGCTMAAPPKFSGSQGTSTKTVTGAGFCPA